MPRLFQPTANPAAAGTLAGAATGSLRAITYNLLADKYATSGFHSYCPARWLEWGHRLPLILRELDGYDADVICLQEARILRTLSADS